MKTLWYTVDQDGNFDIGRGDTEIAKVYSGRDDARLLAHAPELLDELQAILDIIAGGAHLDPEFDGVRIHRLITKATGV